MLCQVLKNLTKIVVRLSNAYRIQIQSKVYILTEIKKKIQPIISNSRLKTIGTVEQKLTVLANEELFQATKEKVISVAEEEKRTRNMIFN